MTSTQESPDLLLERLARNASHDPNKPVFSMLGSASGGARIAKSYSYAELEDATDTLALYLLTSGLKKGDRALLVYPPSLDFIIAFFACLKAGVVGVPVFPPNPARRDTLHMFSKISESCGAQHALTSVEYNYMKKLAGVKDALTRFLLRGATWPDNLQWITTDNVKNTDVANSPPLEVSVESSDLAFLQYTSGSTSEPKGVMITHANLAHNLTIITNELKAKKDTVVVSWLPQYHDMGLIGSYLGISYCGGSGVYLSPLTFLQRPMMWIEAVSKYGGTHLQAPNFAFKLTARKFDATQYVNNPLDLSKVRHIINAAEPIDEAAMETFYAAFLPFGLPRVIYPTYGLAEHTVFVCSGGKQILSVRKATLEMDGQVQVLGDVGGEADDTVSKLVGCGYPAHQSVDVRIVDHDTCHELPPDRVGEIWVNSPSKAAGYFGKRAETKEDFHARIKEARKPNPNPTGYLRTGDLGFLHNDELFICGRIKDLIIVGGRNYYPQDIEATAEATSDNLRPGCSAAFTIDPTREGDEEVALIMELREVPSAQQAAAVCDALANDVKAAITQEHSLGVSQIVFLKTKTVPKTSSGKIARAWCRKGFLAGTLQVVYRRSFKDNKASFEIEQTSAPQKALTGKAVEEMRSKSKEEIMESLRSDIAKFGQVPVDAIDTDTALVTILDSMSISQFKGRLEGGYAVKISDEYLFGESTTIAKLAEVVKLGYAPDDVGHEGGDRPQASTMVASHGHAGGIAGALGEDASGVFDNSMNNYLHRTERHTRAVAKHVRMVEICRKLGIGDDSDGHIIDSPDFWSVLNAVGDDLPTALQWVMFVPNIVSLCDDEQKAEWLPLCRDWRMIGCYAQTELGHGSNVRALETTATFVPESVSGMKGGSWKINSPTLTSGKFWPGTLGKSANYAMVIARLIDGEGTDQGVHNFLVPIRSMEDHTLLPGVKAGDIGPKIGYNVMDNGFCYFDNVLIPRRNMAMRYSEVGENGKYRKKKVSAAASKISYVTMMQVRARIVMGAGLALGSATTISLRYSAVRKQGFGADGVTERQILDYKQQQHRIFPLLAASYCFFFSGRSLWTRLDSLEARILDSKEVSKVEFADIHAALSSLKSLSTMIAADGIEECRRACGGHGFLACSALPELYTTYLQSPTVEGDNHMLPQQVMKVLLKLVEAVQTKDGVDAYKPCLSYGLIPSLEAIIGGGREQCQAVCADNMCELPTLILALRHRAARLLIVVAKQIMADVSNGKDMAEAWNDALVAMSKASKAYALFLLVEDFVNGIQVESRSQLLGQAEVDTLASLAKLFALYWVEKDIGEFLEDGYISSKQASWIAPNVIKYLDIVRPNAIALVDARDISDFRLKSALGRFDGDVYPAIMEAALKDPLNADPVTPTYEPSLKRLIVDGVGVYTGTTARL
eukprot:Nitzschia sp. Nitz4//scaffold260_size33533//8060//12901//NITZ4_007878-RA/size33533-processed-gene-0.0-mRNA-1//1//CDS//3329544680//8677//frame0